jgi:DNA-binding transcriptional LysR family regulator
MDKLHVMETFVAIADRGSLTAAASALDTSLPSVVRSLAALEKHLGVRLFHRTTRRLSLTEEGRAYLERCRQVLEDIREAESVVSAGQRSPTGRLTVTAPTMFGRSHVAPVLHDYLLANPGIVADLRLLDRWADLVEEGVDLGIRVGRLEDSSLVALPCGHLRRVMCASPKYLERAGRPEKPSDLKSHACIRRSGRASGTAWTLRERGKDRVVPVDGPLIVNQVESAIEACRAGIGLAIFLDYQVRDLLDAGSLEIVLAAYEPPPLPVQAVYVGGRVLPSRVRGFLDMLVPRLRQQLSGPAPRRRDAKK